VQNQVNRYHAYQTFYAQNCILLRPLIKTSDSKTSIYKLTKHMHASRLII